MEGLAGRRRGVALTAVRRGAVGVFLAKSNLAQHNFFFFLIYFYFWLCWVFVSVRGFL